MKVNIKKLHENAVIPTQGSAGAAGLDLTAVTVDEKINQNNYQTSYIEYDTGLAIEIPEGHVGLIFPRSSISNYDLSLANAVGVIDSDYRGSIKFRFKPTREPFTKRYNPGDRVGQLIIIPVPKVELVVAEELDGTTRGQGGYGSTGK